MKNILIISQYFSPDVTAAAFRMSETAELLQDWGYKVRVLTAKPHKSNAQDKSIFDEKNVVRVSISELSGRKARSYLRHYLSFMFNSFFGGLFRIRDRIDYVIATSPPLFVGLSGWLIAKFKRAGFVLDIRDIWPDSAVGTGHIRKQSLVYKVGKVLEGFIYHRADIITCVSNKMKEYIQGYLRKDVPVLVLYNGLSNKFLGNLDVGAENNNVAVDEFIISYIGNFGYAQNLDLVIEVVEKLRHKNLKFVLIGEGTVKNNILEQVKQKNLKNINLKESCSKEKAFKAMLQSQALFFMLNKESDAFKRTIPSKVFDYLWANKPILFGIEGEGKEILGSLSGNLYFDAADAGSFINSVTKLYENYNFYKINAEENRDFVLKNFTREKMVERLAKYLLSIN